MTHTLHRHGTAAELANDFVVTVMPAKGYNDRDAVPKLKTFLRAALDYGPVNLGDSSKGAEYRPAKDLRPTVHWSRDSGAEPEAVIAAVDSPTALSAVFDDYDAVCRFIAHLRSLDLGLSVNLACVPQRAVDCCRDCGIVRHSVEYSLGFAGGVQKLPDDTTLALSSMCGHGMIAASFARKMLDWVRSGRRSPEQASRYLARFCVCGSYNPSRARAIFERVGRGR